ncbi:ABC transporter substrate-binding protein [Aquabacter spiritensis]|uniref:Putative spermidine/putrescine transport system substrate-binding protein n=1 Tax=Aquabacter spiritensis TaxID=933073 RepID=A0A4R3LPE0_9HYPH|nr:extracellular solute-binding protein [Aquabacter spiritensis]TCT02242.1 putative spermidine/putrescine transport system substrate-binding protein [Aquabacter spiritensis]
MLTRFGRRAFLAATIAALGFAQGFAAPAGAQQVSMAAWGGGVGATWRESFAKQFQAETGIPVTVTDVPSPEAQIRAQKGAPQYNAAIVTFFEAANLYRDGLIESFSDKDLPIIADVPAKSRLTGPDGRLLGMPVYFMYYGIAVNTALAKPSDFASWKDLAAAKWKGQLAVTRPIYASTYDLTVLAYASGGNEKDVTGGIELFDKIAGNAMTVYSSMAQMNQLISRGEVAAGPYYSTRIWSMKREGLKDVDFVLPKEGALMLPYVLVVPKGAPDLETAKKWLNYAGTTAPQLRATAMSGYFPLNDTAKLPAAEEQMLGMPLAALKAKLIQPDWMVIAAAQRERANIVEQILAKNR